MGDQKGVSMLELLIAVAIIAVTSIVLTLLMVENGKINKREQLMMEAQANARNVVSRVVSTLRSAGWDPGDHGIASVALDPNLADNISQIEVFIDRDGDGVTTGTAQEQILFRHRGNRVEWRTDGTSPFRLLADNISNDADGDGTVEPMFTPNDTTSPTRILVQVTAEAPDPDPRTGEPLRYTMVSEVALRKAL